MAGLKRVFDAIKAQRKKEAFMRKCRKVADATGVSVYFPDEEDGRTDEYEDDGALHICRGVRACFDVGKCQELDGPEQDANTIAVMTALGMAKKIGERVLCGESEEDDRDDESLMNRCPHCKREL